MAGPVVQFLALLASLATTTHGLDIHRRGALARGQQLEGRLTAASVNAEVASEESFVSASLGVARQVLLEVLAGEAATAMTAPTSAAAAARVGNTTVSAKSSTPHSVLSSKKKNTTDLLLKQDAALKKLLAHLKSNIGSINKEEVGQKVSRTKEIEGLQRRLAEDQEKLKGSLTEDERAHLVNHTKVEEEELNFYTRDRELQHGMYHSSLKINNDLIRRVNDVVQAYNEVMSTGKLTQETHKKLSAAGEHLHAPA